MLDVCLPLTADSGKTLLPPTVWPFLSDKNSLFFWDLNSVFCKLAKHRQLIFRHALCHFSQAAAASSYKQCTEKGPNLNHEDAGGSHHCCPHFERQDDRWIKINHLFEWVADPDHCLFGPFLCLKVDCAATVQTCFFYWVSLESIKHFCTARYKLNIFLWHQMSQNTFVHFGHCKLHHTPWPALAYIHLTFLTLFVFIRN